MYVTLSGIENTDEFFEMVENCSGPVTVSAAGHSEDLRGNEFLKALLSESSGSGQIGRLELNVETASDLPVFYRYLIEAGTRQNFGTAK